MDEIGVWLMGGGGGEKIGGATLFSLWAHQNSITPNWGENTRENKSLIFGQLPLANTNIHHYAFFPFCLFHKFVSCAHLFLLFITAIIFYFVLTSFFLSLFWDVAFFFFSFFFFLGRGRDFVLFFFFLLFF